MAAEKMLTLVASATYNQMKQQATDQQDLKVLHDQHFPYPN